MAQQFQNQSAGPVPEVPEPSVSEGLAERAFSRTLKEKSLGTAPRLGRR